MGFKSFSGTGTIYMAPVNAAGVKTGAYKLVGDAYPLSIKVETKQITVKSRRVETAGQVIAAKNEVTDTAGSLTLREWNAANLAWALSGIATAQTAAGSAVVDEVVVAPVAGDYVELAHRDLSAVVVKHTSGAPTYVAGTDYTVDARLGLLTIIAGGGIIAAASLKVSYTYAAKAGYVVDVGSQAQIRVAILGHLFNEFSSEHFDLEIDSAVLAASKEINFISDAGSDGEQLDFSMTLETVAGKTSPGRVNGISM